MAKKKQLTAADMMELDAKRMLRGALGKLGGPERLGELLAELGDNSVDFPSATSDAIRARVLTELARLLGQYGSDGAASGLADQEALDAFIAQHEAKRPDDDQEPFDDDDADVE